ncbi:MAG TPA: hypothetical protein DCM14_01545, partial [Clostridiales bacterium UBA8153]|nr:hypothetical protein [Clostridiales bacterium UBA8153]
FLLGQLAARHPHLKAAIAGAGHELGNHSHTHARLTRLAMSGIRTELSRARAAIGPHAHFRPPYGAFNRRVQEARQHPRLPVSSALERGSPGLVRHQAVPHRVQRPGRYGARSRRGTARLDPAYRGCL